MLQLTYFYLELVIEVKSTWLLHIRPVSKKLTHFRNKQIISVFFLAASEIISQSNLVSLLLSFSPSFGGGWGEDWVEVLLAPFLK
jgi:hypothetical protein